MLPPVQVVSVDHMDPKKVEVGDMAAQGNKVGVSLLRRLCRIVSRRRNTTI